MLVNIRESVSSEIAKVVVGREKEADLLLVTLLARGHVLLEGAPGVSKTLLANTFSKCVGLGFRRVQFTPDMMPLDIVGGFIFNMRDREFEFRRGPVFTNILLADEINRTSPKVQSALLEAMQELQVTVEGHTEKLPTPFIVIATQNPYEFEGVYPLPEGQLDRFMMKIPFNYPDVEVETKIFQRNLADMSLDDVKTVLTLDDLRNLFGRVDEVVVSAEVLDYIARIAKEIRSDSRIMFGVSSRAMVQLIRCCQANAFLDARSYVDPDDVKSLIGYSLSHRLKINDTASLKGEVEGPELILNQVLDKVKPPR